MEASAKTRPEYQLARVAQCEVGILGQEKALEITPAMRADWRKSVSGRALGWNGRGRGDVRSARSCSWC